MTSQLTALDLSRLIAGLEQPLQLVPDPELRERLRIYVQAAKPQVERAAFDLLAQTVQVINDASPDQLASLIYADGTLNVQVQDVQEDDSDAPFSEDSLERVTLRLPKGLKDLIDVAAARRGISANSWYVRSLSRAVARQLREAEEGGEREGGHGRRRRGGYRGRGGRSRGPAEGDK